MKNVLRLRYILEGTQGEIAKIENKLLDIARNDSVTEFYGEREEIK